MINLPREYDMNTPEGRGWLALYLAITTRMSGDEALKRMGIKTMQEGQLK